jgi:hypothetical protein
MINCDEINLIEKYLHTCQENLSKILIDKDFINYRNELAKKLRQGGRNLEQFTRDCDCVVLEYYLIKNNLVEAPIDISHDFICKNKKIDAKIVYNWFNVSDAKKQWYIRNIKNESLDAFALYRYVNTPKKALQEGDIVEIKLLEVVDARSLIKSLSPSIRDAGGFYYTPNDKSFTYESTNDIFVV